MERIDDGCEDSVEFVYRIPTRNIIGLRTLLLTLTKGTVLFSSQIDGYEPVGKELPKIRSGVIITTNSGDSLAYGLAAAEERGTLFIGPAVPVYEGMIVGQNTRGDDMVVNPTKAKQLTNVRASGTDEALTLIPHIKMTLEQALEFIEDDELVEVTPLTIRLRKRYLKEHERKRASRE